MDLQHSAPAVATPAPLAEEGALYLRIAQGLAEAIRRGGLARGQRLPSVRETARQHGVAISTAVQAYHWLEDARLIEARPRSGFFVAGKPAARLPEPSFTRPLRRAHPVCVDVLGQRLLGPAQARDVVSFSSGTPGEAMLDAERVRRTLVRAVQRHRGLLCHYPEPHGHVEARRALARYALHLGCSLDPERITLTAGCMEAISLCLRTVTRPGDVVAIESPTHYSFLELLQSLHLRALEIPTHPRHGLSLDALQLALDTQPVKAVMVVPTLSNPLGSCMPLAERRRLAQMATRHDIAVIEDAVYNDLVFHDELRRTVKSYDTSGHVMLCDSFTKTVAPGLRLGWVEAGRWTDELRRLKNVQGAQTAVLELAVADLLSQAGHSAQMRQLRSWAAGRLDLARGLIAEHFPAGTRVSDPPGGFLLWVELPRGLEAQALQLAAQAEGILVAPGSLFSAHARFKSCLRIGVGADWSERHPAALRRVGELARAMRGAAG
ncbi:PLP-dependent aminotransferase family protein [Pelomonas sp. CA6]|uniref:aminotransferase-like domain-containing protein n=1 Tax=Pelomonas sp. CA6 TaxID=2907999 RepID=UPI001F4AD3EC|nr:PLP-dependent aminotransferase family protein [Pelomonas sp. CA6]MCH7342769.1 PLP-dependent aminotransferase family protein [Pelomonas sp. CA6]